jgi:hypothetical protein
VPKYTIQLTLGHTVIPSMIEQLLRTLHGHRTLGGNEIRDLHRGTQGSCLGRLNLTDVADGQCLLCAEYPRGHAHVFNPGLVADNLGESAERADVRSESDVHLLDGEFGVLGAYPYVRAT